MTDQFDNITRVSDAIGVHVTAFVRGHLHQEFHVEDLRRYICDRVTVAPSSPDRIMRDLRAKGKINYEVVNRRKSLYVALPVNDQLTLF